MTLRVSRKTIINRAAEMLIEQAQREHQRKEYEEAKQAAIARGEGYLFEPSKLSVIFSVCCSTLHDLINHIFLITFVALGVIILLTVILELFFSPETTGLIMGLLGIAVMIYCAYRLVLEIFRGIKSVRKKKSGTNL